MVGVASNFKDNSLEAGEHTFSEFKEYNEKTAKDDCIKIVNMIQNYWKAVLNNLNNQ